MGSFIPVGIYSYQMKVILKIVAGLLLAFNGAGAVYGGYHLISHPDGSTLQMSTDYLRYSPFENYFIPGIILFVFNGVSSFFVFGAVIAGYRRAALLIAAQGAILTGWIVVQVMMVSYVYYLHFVLGGCGLLLILCGAVLHRMNRRVS